MITCCFFYNFTKSDIDKWLGLVRMKNAMKNKKRRSKIQRCPGAVTLSRAFFIVQKDHFVVLFFYNNRVV